MKTFLSICSLLIVFGSCQAQKDKQLDVEGFEKAIQGKKVQLLDVRTAEEFRSGHLAHALQANWNNQTEFTDRTQHLDKSIPVYVYCLSGARSAAAASVLRKQGYEVYELKGGILQWKAAGKPLEGASSKAALTPSEYAALTKSQPVVLVDFGAEWCPPCKKMEPVINSLVAEKGSRFRLVKVDGGNDTEVMKQQGVEALPVFIVYKNGKEVWRKQGIVSKEELEKNL